MSIPVDSKHVDNAHKFLEFLLQSEVIAGCTNFINYANGNLASKKFVKPEILSNPAIYPDEATKKKLSAPKPLNEKPLNEKQDSAMTRAFAAIKSR